MNARLFPVFLLVVLGAGWGITQPLTKIAVSDGYRHFGIIFWQAAIGAVLLFAINTLRGKRLPLGRGPVMLYIFIALVGTVLPNASSYEAAVHLPAGILSIAISSVPMFAFPIALALHTDRFEWPRFLGLLAGLLGVILLIAPDTSLPDPAMALYIPLAFVAPFFYGIEGNAVARWGTQGLDPIQVLLGASVVGAIVAVPLALLSGSWITPRLPLGMPDLAVIASSSIHAVVYSTYVWLVGRAGATFAAQVSYVVTGFGIVWAIVLLGESYSGWVWGSLGLMFIGLFLVQPRAALPDQGEPETQ